MPTPAEAAAAEALTRAGFSALRFVPTSNARTADLVGERAGVRVALELRSSSRPLRADASFEPAGPAPLQYPTLESYLALLWREKSGQLAATMAAERCARGLLVVSVTGERGPAWERALARAYEEAGRPAAVGLALLSGDALLAFPSL